MLNLIFWRWVVVLHDRLHDARDKTELDNLFYTYNPDDETSTYTSPSVHYLGSRRRHPTGDD